MTTQNRFRPSYFLMTCAVMLATVSACDEAEPFDEDLEDSVSAVVEAPSASPDGVGFETQLMDQDMVIELVDADDDMYGYDLNEDESLEYFGPDYVEYEGVPGLGSNGLPTNVDEVTLDGDPWGLFKVFEQNYWFGGDLFGKTYDIIRGPADCGGRRRSHTTAYVDANMGHAGSCFWVGWATSNPYDCRARVRINRPGWYNWGICQIDIYAY